MNIDTELLHRFEKGLNPQRIERSGIPAQLLGYGEISAIFRIQGDDRMAFKRMPLFTQRRAAEKYVDLYGEYCRLLEMAGIGMERLHLEWVSSAEAQRFVDIVTKAVETVRGLGKLDGGALAMELEAVEMTLNSECIRWMVGKEVTVTRDGDVYGRKWETDEYEAVLDNELEREFQKNMIYLAIQEGFTSVRDVSSRAGIPVLRVSYLLADLEKTNRVEFTGMKERKPVFAAL